MADRRPRILGVSWRRLENVPDENEENISENFSPSRDQPPALKTRKSDSSIGSNAPKKIGRFGRRLSHAVSLTRDGMMDTFGSFRQKIRSSTRRRKRLFEVQSPYHGRTPAGGELVTPPGSAQRRSARIAAQQTTPLYSPFQIDTPSSSKRATTPGKIRMGTHEPKRFNFSSPGQLQRDLNTVEESLKQLNQLSEQICSGPKTPRNGIRTTPGGRRSLSTRRKPVFV